MHQLTWCMIVGRFYSPKNVSARRFSKSNKLHFSFPNPTITFWASPTLHRNFEVCLFGFLFLCSWKTMWPCQPQGWLTCEMLKCLIEYCCWPLLCKLTSSGFVKTTKMRWTWYKHVESDTLNKADMLRQVSMLQQKSVQDTGAAGEVCQGSAWRYKRAFWKIVVACCCKRAEDCG